MAFTCRIPVRFADIDAARIVYYPKVLHFCHVAMEEMFGSVTGVPYHRMLFEEEVGYPVVTLKADYEHPVPYGEVLEMSVAVERIGTSSVDFRYEGRRTSDGVLAFRVRSTSVATHMTRWESVPIPDHHREGLASIQDA